jgi:NAD(P)-dependent dehydrogenase (short-subunit alcohol dehydrogenase family)
MQPSAGGSKCKRFEGKTVLITAATAGIGKAISERLAEEGAAVFLCSRCVCRVYDMLTSCKHRRICQLLLTGSLSCSYPRKQQSVDETVAALKAKGYKAAGCACHVGNPQQLKAFVEAGVKVSRHHSVLPPPPALRTTVSSLEPEQDWGSQQAAAHCAASSCSSSSSHETSCTDCWTPRSYFT